MNYGSRQARAEMLVSKFRDIATRWPNDKFHGRSYAEVAHEIEQQSEFGRGIVAVGGLVLAALGREPTRP
jgi:hypothetical protein